MSNKLGGITLLLAIGLISLWQTHKNTIDSVNSGDNACKDLTMLDKRCTSVKAVSNVAPPIHNEMNNLSESYWSQYLCRKNDSFYIVFDNTLYELKDIKFKGINYELSPADKLNGVERSGNLSTHAIVSRSHDKDGRWTKWSDYKPPMNVKAEKINGQWQVQEWKLENHQKRFTLPDCSKLP